MAVVPFELRYSLSRWQRLAPHLRLWGPLSVLVPCVMAVLVASALVTWWAGLGAVVWALLFRNFFCGLADVALRRSAPMDLRIEENGLGFLANGERWWLFLDGLTGIDQLAAGVWTLQHWNGSVVHIPAAVISDEQLAHLRTAMARGRTPEGVQAVIERGRRLAEMERGGQ
ncbi:MAG TPA: hypothetical protein VNK04_17715 [Gemmataceae bacterium]|nr:hypothetical protein [Gemmataceae bacterium]